MTGWRLGDWWQWLLDRWWMGVPLMLGGALVGVVLARWVLPTPYWADAVFTVGINVDAVRRYPEDYKNWMLTELNGFVTSKPVLEEVLAALPNDPYWRDWTPDDLAPHLETRWFDVGDWHLHASADSPDHASTLAGVWGAVALRHIRRAIAAGEAFLQADRRWQQLEARRVTAEAALAHVGAAREALDAWLPRLQAGATPTPADRAELRYWAAFAVFPDGGQPEPLPPADAPSAAYVAWVKAVQRQLQAAAQVWRNEILALTAAQRQAAAVRDDARQETAGVSSYWQVALAVDVPGARALEAHEPALWADLSAQGSGLKPRAQPVYGWQDGAAVGAFAGVVVWLALALVGALAHAGAEEATDA